MTKHTKGPWGCSREDMDSFAVNPESGEAEHVVYVYINGKPRLAVFGGSLDNAREDGRLIAASPDLLQALKEMKALVDDLFKSNNMGKLCFQNYARLNEAPSLATLAIAKAEGGK